MNKADVEFTIGLNTSPAEQQLDRLYEKIKSKDNIVYAVSVDSDGFIPTTAKNIPTDFSNNNLPINSITRELEKIVGYMHYESQGISGWRYAGYSTWNEQKKIGYDNLPSNSINYSYEQQGIPGWRFAGSSVWNEQKKLAYDNLPTFSANNRLQETINFMHEQQQLPGWRYAGSSTAESIYKDFENINNKPLLLEDKSSVVYTQHPWQEKHMADINKKDNIELKDKLLLWSKILATIYAVKKVLDGLIKAWKFGAEVTTSRNNNINEELGYFSVDPEGAMRANVDKTRSMWYAGVRNMGANSPVSKAGLDEMASMFTEMWTAAMSGRNVDARTTIDAQRVKEFFGADYTIEGLLTGIREGKTATDIQRDLVQKVEQQIHRLAEVDEIQRGQLIDSLKHLFGSELIDAIVANANKNKKVAVEDRMTVIERLERAGGSALSPQDLTAKTASAVQALTDFQTALETLKNTITVTFAPAFVSVTNTLTEFVNWLNRKMTKKEGEKDETGAFSSDVAPEAISSAQHINWISKTSDQGNIFGTPSERATKASNLLKNASNANDILDAVYLLNPFVQTEGDIEGLKSRRFAREAGEALLNGNIDPNSPNPYIRKIANYQYNGLTGVEAFKQAFSRGEFGNVNQMGFLQSLILDPESLFGDTVEDFLPENFDKLSDKKKEKALKSAEKQLRITRQKRLSAVNQLMETDEFGRWVTEVFGEGGEYDIKENESIAGYTFNPYSYETAEDYYNALKSLKESFDKNNWGREYISSFDLPSMEELAGKDGKLDFGEVTFRLTLTDQAGKVLGSQEIVGAVQ